MTSSFLIGFTILCAILDDRLVVAAGGAAGGELSLVPLMAVVVAAIAVARRGSRTLWFCAAPIFLIGVLPYVALTIVLPIAGVVLTGFPDRTMLTMLSGISAFSFMVIGAALSTEPDRSWTRWLLFGITLQLAYAIGQAASLGGGLAAEVFAPFHAWDLSLVDIETFVQARSTGLYLNPNELGFWAALATVLSLTVLRGRARYAGVILALATLILAESRGSIVALAAAAVLGLGLAWRRGGLGWPAVRAILLGAGLLLVLVVVVFALRPSETGATRLLALLDVVTQGPEADPNLRGRIDFWRSVLDYLDTQPFGSLGSPELAIGIRDRQRLVPRPRSRLRALPRHDAARGPDTHHDRERDTPRGVVAVNRGHRCLGHQPDPIRLSGDRAVLGPPRRWHPVAGPTGQTNPGAQPRDGRHAAVARGVRSASSPRVREQPSWTGGAACHLVRSAVGEGLRRILAYPC